MTTNDETYNGWTNRETWAFMLHVQNDEGLSEWARAMAVLPRPAISLEGWARTVFTRDGYADEYGATWPDSLADIAAEIGSLWRINWYECVDSLTDGE